MIFFVSEGASFSYLTQAVREGDWDMVSFLATLHHVRFVAARD